MKDGLAKIVGRRIAGVVVAQSPRGPRQQVFLVFEDGTRFEFWGENFSCCSDVDKAAGLADYVEMAGGKIVAMYGTLEDRPRKLATTSPFGLHAFAQLTCAREPFEVWGCHFRIR